jgi:hypothetical protein
MASTAILGMGGSGPRAPEAAQQLLGGQAKLEGLPTVDLDDRYLVAEASRQIGIPIDVHDFEGERALVASALDLGEGLLAEAAVRSAVDHDARTRPAVRFG